MIDKLFYKFFSAMDNICEWIANKIAGPRCKCKKKKDAQAGPKVDCPIKNVVRRYKRTPWKKVGL